MKTARTRGRVATPACSTVFIQRFVVAMEGTHYALFRLFRRGLGERRPGGRDERVRSCSWYYASGLDGLLPIQRVLVAHTPRARRQAGRRLQGSAGVCAFPQLSTLSALCSVVAVEGTYSCVMGTGHAARLECRDAHVGGRRTVWTCCVMHVRTLPLTIASTISHISGTELLDSGAVTVPRNEA